MHSERFFYFFWWAECLRKVLTAPSTARRVTRVITAVRQSCSAARRCAAPLNDGRLPVVETTKELSDDRGRGVMVARWAALLLIGTRQHFASASSLCVDTLEVCHTIAAAADCRDDFISRRCCAACEALASAPSGAETLANTWPPASGPMRALADEYHQIETDCHDKWNSSYSCPTISPISPYNGYPEVWLVLPRDPCGVTEAQQESLFFESVRRCEGLYPGHVHGHVHGHVYRHVYRHVFPPNPCPPRLYFASLCNCLEILMNALVPSLENIYECLQLSTNICGYR